MAENLSESEHPKVEERLRIGPIVRDVIIIWILTSMGGFVIGFALAGVLGAKEREVGAYAVSNLLFGTLGFTIAGFLAPSRKWRHLGIVAIGVWFTSLINVMFLGVSVPQWIGGAIFLAIFMGLGGAISNVLRRVIKPTVA
jgi:FtsH-binding integral membrane protein